MDHEKTLRMETNVVRAVEQKDGQNVYPIPQDSFYVTEQYTSSLFNSLLFGFPTMNSETLS